MNNKIIYSIQKQLIELTGNKFSKRYIESYIIPIINFIISSKEKKFLISGSQGIGKSTLLKILEKNIKKFYKKNILTMSLDDYYLSKIIRKKLSKKIHPLFLTRGVPGTHNIKEIIKNIKFFENSKIPIYLPIFEKIADNVSKKRRKINFKTDILILEGWCCGSPPITDNYLYKNINNLEKNMDQNMIWRTYYNEMLKKDYNNLFKLFDKIIYLKAPSFKFILNWRLKQEINMKIKNEKIMNKEEVLNFILYYEKLTKWMMKIMPAKANMTIFVNKKQKINKIKLNK